MNGSNAGASWKIRREEMKKSIEDVSAALRISHRYLRGIEEGNYKGWPEKVFSTGFIRSYAKFLSVDPSPVLAEYEQGQEKATQQEEASPATRPEWLERERERGSRKTTYIFAAGVVLLVGIVLAFFSVRDTERPAPPPPVAQAPPPAGDNVAAGEAAAPAPGNHAAPADNAVAAPADNAAAAPVPPADNAAAAPASTVAAVGSAGPLTGPFQLFLEASEHTWIMYSFDDGEPIDVTLFMGDKISIQANRSINLKIGNAGGVFGTLNGQRLPPFGESGQVRNIKFGQ